MTDEQAAAAGQARHLGVAHRRGPVPGDRPRRRLGHRRPDRPDDRPRPARQPRRRPRDRPDLRHQRQDHHHPAHRRRAGRARRRGHQLASAPTCPPGTRRRWPRPAPRRTRCSRSTSTTSPRSSTPPTPRVVALLNLSRDQLDRAKEVAMMAPCGATRCAAPRHPRRRQRRRPDGHLGRAGRRRTSPGSAAGQRWHDDSWVCPECGSHIERERRAVVLRQLATCAGPVPQWTVEGDGGRRPHRRPPRGPPAAARPGQPGQRRHRAGRRGPLRGPRRRRPLPQLAEVTSIAGRYATVERDGRTIRLLLAKNPAGWLEAFDMAEDAPTLLVDQRPRPRRARHLLALRRRLLRRCAAAGC